MRATPHAITEPLNFRGYIRVAPKVGFDLVAVLDLILIIAFLGLQSSRYFFAPGAEVSLVETRTPELGGVMPSAVLTMGRNDLIFFEGKKIAPQALASVFAEYLGNELEPSVVLLVKMDKDLNLEKVFWLFDLAKEAGFERVQLAAEEASDDTVIFGTH